MKLEIKTHPIKKHIVFIRLDESLFKQITTLQKQHKAERSAVIRGLIEAGLKVTKTIN